ncbi:peptidoglycan-associated lipoprotein Pal [Paracoccus sp. p3-h83]|uniref:peptidoglycan-associated lipoprotein Pal n=1 Tax=Paracoccus sp. p3-h83 TaxID=3342805 RepID=UPI0035B75998
MAALTKTLPLAIAAALALTACAPKPTTVTPLVDPYAGMGQPAATSPTDAFAAVGDRVHFANDQSTLDTTARGILDGQARWLSSNPSYVAMIEGHADEQGTREYNLALGARRASSVQQYLVAQGVAPVRLRTVSYGKERPIEICSTEVCFAKNRRAVTVVSPGVGS